MALTMNIAKIITKKDMSDSNNRLLTQLISRAILDDKILIVEHEVTERNSCNLELDMYKYDLFTNTVQGKWSYGKQKKNALSDFQNLLIFTNEFSSIDYFKNSIKINLNGQNFNPYILGKLLEKVGYEMEDDALVDYTNGWENDFWIRYNLINNDESMPTEITICGSLMTFELGINIGGY